MHKARIIITFDCPKNCVYCSNNHEEPFKNAVYIDSLDELPMDEISEVIITGGEPSVAIGRVSGLLKHTPDKIPVYLYTARWTEELEELAYETSGISYTLHDGTNRDDMYRFESFVDWAYEHDNGWSNRILIHPSVDWNISIVPTAFTRIEMKPFLESCPLPENEVLYIWKE